MKSRWVRREVLIALKRKREIVVVDINDTFSSLPNSHPLKRRIGELLTIRERISDSDGNPTPATVKALIDGFTKLRRRTFLRAAGISIIFAFTFLIFLLHSVSSKSKENQQQAGRRLALEQAINKLDALNQATRDEKTASEEFVAAKVARTAAEKDSREKAAVLPAIEKQTAAQDALVRTIPREVPAISGPVRGRLGGGPLKIPMKANPELPAAESKLKGLRAKLTKAIQDEKAANVRLEQANAAVSAAQSKLDTARTRLDETPGNVLELELEIKRLRDAER